MTQSWNILGHAWVVDMLRQQIARNAVRHAYLFAGPPGVGRRTLALRFAQALNCTQPIEPGVPCGDICPECRQIDSQRHPDVSLIEAETDGGTLKVDQVRDAQWNLNLKPYQARYRVVVFPRFQNANDSASNALLKTLEEAPSHAVLMLTSDNPESLLPTIVSRCEVLRLAPLPLETVSSWLMQHGADSDLARLISHLSGGCPGFALSLLQNPSALEYRDQKLKDLTFLIPASRSQKFAYAEKLGKDRVAARRVLIIWLGFWRDVLWRASGATAAPVNLDRTSEIEALANRIGVSVARRVVSDLKQALEHLEASVNPRLLTEVLLLDWPK